MKPIKAILVIFLILLSGGINVSGDSPHNESEDRKVRLALMITDAYYLDADGDGEEDDIKAYFEVTIDSEKDEIDFKIQFNIKLVLDSGDYFKHKFKRDVESSHLNYELTMYNHAIEPGFYDLFISIKTKNGAKTKVEAWKTFDPPGGQGGDPFATLT